MKATLLSNTLIDLGSEKVKNRSRIQTWQIENRDFTKLVEAKWVTNEGKTSLQTRRPIHKMWTPDRYVKYYLCIILGDSTQRLTRNSIDFLLYFLPREWRNRCPYLPTETEKIRFQMYNELRSWAETDHWARSVKFYRCTVMSSSLA